MKIAGIFMKTLLSASVLTGCAARYQDVSVDTEVKSLPGLSCTTKVDLIEHGVVAYGSSKRDGVTSFVLTPRPGFGGREVLSTTLIPAGHRIKVLSVRKCTNCLTFGAGRLDLQVQLDGADTSLPIYLGGSFANTEVLLKDQARYVVNPNICEPPPG